MLSVLTFISGEEMSFCWALKFQLSMVEIWNEIMESYLSMRKTDTNFENLFKYVQ